MYGPSHGGANCVYFSSFDHGVGSSYLLERPGGEPSGHDIAGVFAGTLPTS
jgi:hypothetical protein